MENKKPTPADQYVMYGLIIVAIAAVGFALFNYFSNPIPLPPATFNSNYETITTGTTAEGDIEISLTPTVEENRIIVSAVLNTHSVDLSQFDLQKSMQLTYDSKKILPSNAFVLSGHHGSGQVLFDGDKYINSFTITINGIPALPTRVYSW